MQLRTKIFVLLAAVSVILVCFMYFQLRGTILGSYDRLEEKNIIENTLRIKDRLGVEFESLDKNALDWSNWDEMAAFAKGENPDFPKTNIGDLSFVHTETDIILILNNSYFPMFAKHIDSGTGKELPMPDDLAGHLNAQMALKPDGEGEVDADGIIVLDGGILIAAIESIHYTNSSGPSPGYLFMARFLDGEKIESLADELKYPIEIYPLSKKIIGDERDDDARIRLSSNSSLIFVEIRNNSMVSGYAGFDDIYGKPAVEIETQQERVLHLYGINMFDQFTYFTLAGISAILVLIIVLLDRLFISRIMKVQERILEIGGGKFGLRLEKSGTDDEIATTIVSVNKMLDNLQEAQDTVRESEAKFKVLTENLMDVVARIDLEGKITYISPAISRFAGYSPEDLLGKNFDVVFADGNELLKAKSDLGNAANELNPTAFDFLFRRKNGGSFYVSVSTFTIVENGMPIAIQCVLHDITERKKLEGIIKDEKERLDLALKSAQVVTWEWDPKKDAIIWSGNFGSIFKGMKGSDYNSFKKYLTIIDAPGREKLSEEVSRQLHNSEDFYIEHCYKPDKKECKWLLAEGTIYREGKDPAKVSGTLTDITERKKYEEELSLKGRLLDEASDAIIIYDMDGKFKYWNEKAASLHGYAMHEMGNCDMNTIHFGDYKEIFPKRLEKIRKEKFINYECRHRKKDGTAKIFDVNSTIIDFKGTEAILAVNRDITEKKMLEEQRSEAERQFRTLYDTSADAIMILDPEKGFIAGNPATIQLFACRDESDFTTMGPADLSPRYQPDGRPSAEKAREMVGKALENGSNFFDWRHMRKGGEEFDATVLLTRMKVREKVLIQATVRDVTERKKFEEKLLLQNTALETAANAIAMTDSKGSIIWVNPAFTTLTGYSFEEAIGKNPRILKSGKMDESFYSTMWKTITSGKVWQGEITNRYKDGSLGNELMTISPIRNDKGPITNFIAIKQDITKQKMVEKNLEDSIAEMKRLEETKTEFLNMVSHELKTPITAISAHLDVIDLMKANLNEQEIRSIAAIRRSKEQLQMLIENILEISRMESGRFELNYTKVGLEGLVGEIIAESRIQSDEKGIQLQADVEPGLEIEADETRLKEIIVNLVGNAIKFTEQGGVTVKAEGKGGFAEISVIDSGIGIPADKIGNLFRKFYQVDAKIDRKFGGSGLGLAIVKMLAEAHGGRVTLDSIVGKGSVFTVILPIVKKTTGDGK